MTFSSVDDALWSRLARLPRLVSSIPFTTTRSSGGGAGPVGALMNRNRPSGATSYKASVQVLAQSEERSARAAPRVATHDRDQTIVTARTSPYDWSVIFAVGERDRVRIRSLPRSANKI